MANAKQCDRCSAYYTIPDLTKISPHVIRYNFKDSYGKRKYRELDLCPECEKSLEEWFEDGEQK